LTLQYYGIEYVDMLSPDGTLLAQTRDVAIGASFLDGSGMPSGEVRGKRLTEEHHLKCLSAYLVLETEITIGDSIYVNRRYD
jgi:hypothetical protein